ncbi:MAG: sigma-54 dependent transcriptional regulator [Spirochaetota bacterium]
MSDQKLRIIVLDKQSKYLAAIKQELARAIPQEIEVIAFSNNKQSESYIDIHKEQCAVLLANYEVFDNSIETFLTYKQTLSSGTQIILLTADVDSNIVSLLQNKLVFDLQRKQDSSSKIANKLVLAVSLFLHQRDKETRLGEYAKQVRYAESDLQDSFYGIIGNSQSIQNLKRQIRKVALSDATCLIIGESGTGKEKIAMAIHQESERSKDVYNIINSAAIPAELFESELFGHRKGSFTGAKENHTGILEASSGGSIFFDEITELPLGMQAKLLRFLQEGNIRTIGMTSERKIDVRVIAATNRNIQQAITDKAFRADLYYRLGVIELEVPSLRERKEDIPLLFDFFLQHFIKKEKKYFNTVSDNLIPILLAYSWPGNVRELRNVVHRLVLLMEDGKIHENFLPRNLKTQAPSPKTNKQNIPSSISMKDMEKRSIEEALQLCDGNKEQAAQKLGISRATIFRKIKQYQIETK